MTKCRWDFYCDQTLCANVAVMPNIIGASLISMSPFVSVSLVNRRRGIDFVKTADKMETLLRYLDGARGLFQIFGLEIQIPP